MKQLPNLFTLLNLLAGCFAIVCILQPGLVFSVDANGDSLVDIPEKIYIASICMGIAAVVDFFDGFVARLLKAPSELGKQLDSLADLVSFGVAPGLIAYQFLRLSFAQQTDGLDVNTIWLLPAFILPCAGAYRLARFNIDTEQTYGFKGVPIPAVGLLFASFPLIYWYAGSNAWVVKLYAVLRVPRHYWYAGSNAWVVKLMLNKWCWYAVILLVSYLMTSTLPMMALKFKDFTVKKTMPFILLAVISIAAAIVFGWLAVPVAFITYVVLSLSIKQPES